MPYSDCGLYCFYTISSDLHNHRLSFLKLKKGQVGYAKVKYPLRPLKLQYAESL